MQKNEAAELQRRFCRHGRAHAEAVAAFFPAADDCFSAAALLHDIGRWQQYAEGCDHALASAELAQPLLADAFFSPAEQEAILAAILAHRQGGEGLAGRLWQADKFSRRCDCCPAYEDCNKKEKAEIAAFWRQKEVRDALSGPDSGNER